MCAGRHVVTFVMAFSLSLGGTGPLWSQASTEPSSPTGEQTSQPTTGASTANSGNVAATGHACLTEPVRVAIRQASSGEKAKSAGKGILGSILGSASGGAIRSGGGKEAKLARRPGYPKSKLDISGSKLNLEYQGAFDDGLLRIAVRVNKDPEKGSPHLLVLQDIHCRILLPEKVSVFEFWKKGSLRVGWSSSTYQNGQMTDSSGGGFTTSWSGLKERYPDTSDIPGIWQSYGEEPFKRIRGVTADFQLPANEEFNPQDWYLVAHVTSPGPSDQNITTEPVVTDLKPGKKDDFAFSQVLNVAWQPPLAGAGVSGRGLVCEDDCKKILDDINQLECIKDDCSDEKQAVDDALQAYEDALQAQQNALNDVEHAKSDVRNARQALDKARDEHNRAKEKMAVEVEKQKRLQASLRRGGHGLSRRQINHAIHFSEDVISALEARVEDTRAAVENARNSLNSANAALAAAHGATIAANDDVDQKRHALDTAKKALSDCMQREWERCGKVEELWAEYRHCRRRCRDQEEAKSGIDWSRDYVGAGQQDVADSAQEYDASARERDAIEDATGDLGGSPSSRAREAADEAGETREQAAQDERDAQQKLKEAEERYAKGDLEGATRAADEARALQDKAEEVMEEAADQMGVAAAEARREYMKELDKKLQRERRQRTAAAKAAALKSQVCLRYISEYYEGRKADSSLLKELGGFVSTDARDALDQAGGIAAQPEQLEEFLAKIEEQRQNLERLLKALNGIGDNASLKDRNEAFSTALEVSAEIAERIPGLGEFFNFYSSAYDAAVGALYTLQEEMVGKYKPMVDGFIRVSRRCCSYGYDALDASSLDQMVDASWRKFETNNRTALSRLSSGSLKNLEAYFKHKQTTRWLTCCLEYTLDRQK